MSDDFIKFAFTGGVISSSLVGRDDLEKYELGVLEAKNWFINFQGGASTRAGTAFVDYVEDDDLPIRLEPFRFNSKIANTYILVISDNKIRFVQDGGYVLEAAKTVSAIAPDGTVTSIGHGFINGDWVKPFGIPEFSYGTYEIQSATANTFKLRRVYGTNESFAGTFTSGTFSRIYTISHPYDSAIFPALVFSQNKDRVYITHPDYPPKILSRFAPTNWTLTNVSFSGNSNYPAAPTLTPSSAGSAGVVFGITSVDLAGQESRINNFAINEVSVNYTLVNGQMSLSWPALNDVQYYNIYRSLIFPAGSNATLSQELGYLGRAIAPYFLDLNIVPDFTTQAPLTQDPFNPGAILAVNMTAGGSGYDKTTATISVADGVGFVGRPVVNSAGAVISVMVLQGGKNYLSGSVITFGGGSGATATLTVAPASGTWPQCSTLFQQRRVYAGTDAQPMGIFASRPGQPENFDASTILTAADSYSFELDGQEVTPIKYILASTTGMLVFTDSMIWRLRGAEDQVISGLSALAEPALYMGCATIPPLQIGNDILFVQNKNTAIQSFNVRQTQNQAIVRDLSILSSDFFTQGEIIESWTYAKDPFRLVWANRDDGTFLSMTYEADQNVMAWAEHYTQGYVRWLTSIIERARDRVYMTVERIVEGQHRVFIERMAPRQNLSVEAQWAVDAALASSQIVGLSDLSINGAQVLAATPTFTLGDVGKHLRVNGGRALVTALVNSQELTVEWQLAMLDFHPPASPDIIIPAGDWTLDALQSSFGGLWHLEGKTVQVLADGSYHLDLIVTNGSITLPQPASFVICGLGFDARLKTLPLSSNSELITRLKKRPAAVSVRVKDTRGLFIGDDKTTYEQKGRSWEEYSTPLSYLQGLYEINIGAEWDLEGSIVFEKHYPTNASVLGYVITAELGDV
jgi:hypothetical protein